MIRLFVGLAPPPPAVEALCALMHGIPGARWSEPADLHLTLRFIGEVDEDQATDIDAALAAIRAPAPVVRLRGLGRFGDARRVRVLWAGVEPHPALLHLRGKVESACVRAGLPPERRRFTPHLTLARLDGSASAARVETRIAEAAGWDGGAFVASAFILYSSHLGRRGAHYTVERLYPLDEGGAGQAY